MFCFCVQVCKLVLDVNVDIDILEEFAYLLTPDGGQINLDIMPNSTKGTAQ